MSNTEFEPTASQKQTDTAVYAFVEVFGHRQHCGRIVEIEQFGTKMLRIDEPLNGDFANGYSTIMYGGGSIFSIRLTDLASVEKHHKPWQPRLSPPALDVLPTPAHDAIIDDTDDDDDDDYRTSGPRCVE